MHTTIETTLRHVPGQISRLQGEHVPRINTATLDVTDRLTDLRTYILTYLITPWSRVLLEKLTAFASITKFAAFYGT